MGYVLAVGLFDSYGSLLWSDFSHSRIVNGSLQHSTETAFSRDETYLQILMLLYC
jgi:hypothetical protein